jgi:phosphatidylglycerophosphate synthase
LTGAPTGAKRLDYWWTVLFTDPLAVPLTRLLTERRSITPNQISVLAMVLGFSVGPVFALGTRTAAIAGAVLFYLAFLFDCVDGKLARARGTTSQMGAVLDGIGDAGRRASASAGLLIWLVRYEAELSAVVIGAIYVALAYFFTEISGGSPLRQAAFEVEAADEAPVAHSGWRRTLANHRLLPTPGMPDVQALVFVIGPLTGLVVPALVAGAVIVFAGCLIALKRNLG